MKTTRYRVGARARRIAAVVIAGALVAAACGGDDDDATTATTAAATAGTTGTTDGAGSTTPASTDATTATDTAATSGSAATTESASTDSAPADAMQDPAALEDANRDGTLTVAWQLTLPTLDPLLNANVQNVAYNYPAYDALIYRDPAGDLHPGLAESWEWSDDGTAFTLHLREGVTFHDGSTLDGDVVKANLDRLLALTTSPVINTVANVESVEVTDPMTVVLNMKQPDATIPYSLADRTGMMVSGKALADGVDLNTTEAGAGPYQVVDFKSGDRVTYERFDDYWGDPNAAAAQRLEIIGLADGQARANGVLTGDFDAAYVTPTQVQQVQDAGLDIQAESSLWYIQMYLNRARSEFGNPLVARAMEYAIDRDTICENIYFGFCEPTFKPFPDDYWAGSPDIPNDHYTYDPEKAKELLAEAGLAEGFEFELMIPAASDPYPQFAEVLQAQLAAVGITVNINPVDISQLATTYFAELQSDALLGGGGQVPEPAQLFSSTWKSTSYANAGGVTSPGMDELIDRMNAALDQDERAEIVREGTQVVVDDALNLIFLRPQIIYAVNDNVVNWQPSLVANYPITRGVGVTD